MLSTGALEFLKLTYDFLSHLIVGKTALNELIAG
jgi:hypothetical protein